jgi:hypothetical protein
LAQAIVREGSFENSPVGVVENTFPVPLREKSVMWGQDTDAELSH